MQNFMFSQLWRFVLWFSDIRHRVVWLVVTNVLEEYTDSIKGKYKPDNGSNTFLRNSDTQTTFSQYCSRRQKKLRTSTCWSQFKTIAGQKDWIYSKVQNWTVQSCVNGKWVRSLNYSYITLQRHIILQDCKVQA